MKALNLLKLTSTVLGLSLVFFFTSCQKDALTDAAPQTTSFEDQLAHLYSFSNPALEDQVQKGKENFTELCLRSARANGFVYNCEGKAKISVSATPDRGAFKITTPEGAFTGVVDNAYSYGSEYASVSGHITRINNRPVPDDFYGYLGVSIYLVDSSEGDYVDFYLGGGAVCVGCETVVAATRCLSEGGTIEGNVRISQKVCTGGSDTI